METHNLGLAGSVTILSMMLLEDTPGLSQEDAIILAYASIIKTSEVINKIKDKEFNLDKILERY